MFHFFRGRVSFSSRAEPELTFLEEKIRINLSQPFCNGGDVWLRPLSDVGPSE